MLGVCGSLKAKLSKYSGIWAAASESWSKRLSMIASDMTPVRRIRLRTGQTSPTSTLSTFSGTVTENGYRGLP